MSNNSFFDKLSPKKEREGPSYPSRSSGANDRDGTASHRSRSSHQSQTSRVSTDSAAISVVIGKTFEATTLPDGSHQILEATKYKRLSDGYVYQETKVRNLDDDRSEADEGRSNVASERRDGGVTAPNAIVPPSAVSSRPSLGRLQLNRLSPGRSYGRSPKNKKQQLPQTSPIKDYSPRAYADKFDVDDDKDKDYEEPEFLPTFSSSGSFSPTEGMSTQVSVVTEDHGWGGQPTPRQREMFMEEYLYDDDQVGLQQWREQRSGRRSSQGGERTPHSTSGHSIPENLGWCPAWDDSDDNSLQLAKSSQMGLVMWSPATKRAAARVRSFFPSTPNKESVDVNGCALDVNYGKRRNAGGDEDDEEQGVVVHKTSFSCKEWRQTRRCKGLMFFTLLVVIGTIVAAVLSARSQHGSPTKQIDGEADNGSPSAPDETVPPPCIHLKIHMSATETDDVNSWSLKRTNPDGKIVEIESVEDLPDEKEGTHVYKKCVQPGVYTFTITDSSGNGLGSDGKGGYYITADDVTLGISSFFFHEERMTFTLPFDAEDESDHVDSDRDTACTDDFFLAVKTDDNPGQTRWNLVENDTGKEVLTGGPYDLPQAVYTRRACLPDGAYRFNMLDEGGDGLCCGDGKGFFVLSKDGETIVNSDGNFGEEKSVVFTLGDWD